MVVALLLNTCLAAYAGGGLYYTVKTGDTLYAVGKKFGLNYRSLMENNKLASDNIRPGLKLNVTPADYRVYTVKFGDTLYRIAQTYGLSVTELQRLNGITDNTIRPGMKLMVSTKSGEGHEYEAKPVIGRKFNVTKEDIRLLAQLIHAEARGEPLTGQIAVGAVIMNRMTSGSFPERIREIIYQRTKGVYQFTPVQDGQIRLEPNQDAFSAAERALKGEDPTGGALFFYNPETSSDEWIKTLPVTKIIGNHVFAK
jgi:N-acetylmuramoyl-L-alanine amidase